MEYGTTDIAELTQLSMLLAVENDRIRMVTWLRDNADRQTLSAVLTYILSNPAKDQIKGV